jgi:hypothetical protein
MSVGDDHLTGVADDGPEPDAIARGWVVPPGGSRVDAIFVLSGTSLGIGRIERVTPPVWLNLDELVQLDAIGDPVDGLTEVEIVMEDRRAIGAGWTDDFCDAVVRALRTGSGRPSTPPGPMEPTPAPESSSPSAAESSSPSSPGSFSGSVSGSAPESLAAPAPAAAPAIFAEPAAEPAPAIFGTPAPTPAPAPASAPAPTASPFAAEPVPAPATDPGLPHAGQVAPAAAPMPSSSAPTASLELEDVVYLGGYPGQSKRRKKCVVTMGRTGLELTGPGGLGFRVGWDAVRTVEVQNSDEARFRMNTKIHRDASALVVECEQGVTILLEARDCPTIALRSAIAQLLAGLPVLVV